MKKITFLFVAMSLLIFNSCQKKDDSVNIKSQESIDYSEYGKLHNEGLDHIYQDLKANLQTKKSVSHNDMFEIIANSTNNFIESTYSDKQSISVSRSVVNRMKNNSSKSKETSIDDSSLTVYQKLNIDKMNAILDSEGDLKSHQEKLKDFQLEIESDEVDVDEKAVVLIALSVAQYSLEYWDENIENWIALTEKSRKGYSWSDLGGDLLDMAKYDAGGAVVGAVAGAGVLSAPGAVGGAAYASAGEGVVKLIDSF